METASQEKTAAEKKTRFPEAQQQDFTDWLDVIYIIQYFVMVFTA